MDPGEMTTGTRDEHYNLVSALYHALHGAENCNAYALDAEAAGRIDLADFFREAGMVQAGLADRAKEMLGIRDVPSGADLPEEAAGGIMPGDISGGTQPVDPGDVPPPGEAPGGSRIG
jgi:hypothetical protein